MATGLNTPRKRVEFFVSYAHRNHEIVDDFTARLIDILTPSKTYQYQLWMDSAIVIGEEWEEQIINARDQCDFGLLLVSPAFLASKFIAEKELPHFIGTDRTRCIPIMLQPVDFERHDLKGLERIQIFQFKGNRFKEARAYGKCKESTRDDFILALFQKIEDALAVTSKTRDHKS